MNWKNNTYYLSIAFFTIGICCSKFMMSMGLLLGGIYFFFTGDFKMKFDNLTSNPYAKLILSFYFLHVLALIWSNDFSDGLDDVRQKSTLAIVPIIMLSYGRVSISNLNKIKILFLSTLFITSIINVIGFNLFFEELGLKETRNMSLFIGHIRYSLVIALGAVWCFYEYLKKEFFSTTYLILFCWFTFYSFESEVLSGIIGLSIGLFIVFLWYLLKRKKWFWSIFIFTSCMITAVAILFYLSIPVKNPTKLIEINKSTEKSWNIKSTIRLNELDKKNQPIQFTLNRYLYSMDLPLNENGIEKLSMKDVRNIENGIADIRETQWSIFSRLFKIRYELHSEKNPNLHPIIERFELWKNAWFTIKKNWLFGIGNGGIDNALTESYDLRNSPLEPERRLRPHNMFLTYWLMLGVAGLSALFFLIVHFGYFSIMNRNMLGLVFILIAASSFLSEDTLESQAGITFFSFFYCFYSMFMSQEKFTTK